MSAERPPPSDAFLSAMEQRLTTHLPANDEVRKVAVKAIQECVVAKT